MEETRSDSQTGSTPATPRGADNGDFEEIVREVGSGADLSSERAQRYYDRVRKSIHDYLEKKGKVVEKSGEYLMLVPDMFILLWRLVNDPRVSGKNKVLLGSAIAYYIFPFDIMPEALIGPIGLLDDLVFGVYMLNKMLKDTDAAIVREHWSGSEDILDSIQKVLNAADNLVGSDLLNRLKKMVGK